MSPSNNNSASNILDIVDPNDDVQGNDDDDDDDDNNNNNHEAKRGRSCGGVCCDMRRAVIILSILGILLSILSFVANYFFFFVQFHDDDDDTAPLTLDETDRLDTLFTINIVLTCLAVVSYSLAIYGGITFNARLSLVNAMYVIVNFVTTTVLFLKTAEDIESVDYEALNIIGPAIGAAMTVYVNMTFVREVRSGIMSPKTYSTREEQSCCCV